MSIKSLLTSLCQREALFLVGITIRHLPPTLEVKGGRGSYEPAHGFTLLEVMVSLAIVAGLLVTLIYSLNYHLGIAERHEFTTMATMLAREKLREAAQQPVAGKGSFPDPHASYTYATETKDTDYPGITLLTVTVSRGGDTVRFSEMVEKKRL